ncbi:transcriptional regulator with XRE-family HTH domain [Paenibacillus polymyxa]
MKNATTIRTELSQYMQDRDLSIARFGKMAGMNPGSLSSILNGKKVLSLYEIDRITKAMGFPEGFFYKEYMQECLADLTPNWRRSRPFLYRCAELNRLDYLQQVVPFLLDNLVYSASLFEVAEDLFNQGKTEAAAVLYENVALSEKHQHSERLAMCQYRLFKIRLGQDQVQNLFVAIHFESYVERLDEVQQLDAIKDLANTYRSLRKWDKVKQLAENMHHKAQIQYASKRSDASVSKLSRPLFVYLAYSNLLQAAVYDEWRDYSKALEYTYAYADLSWVKETDEDTQRWIGKFQEWAQANLYANRLLNGEIEVLPEYVSYIASKKDEILFALHNILITANRYNITVDDIIERFSFEIEELMQQKAGTTYIVQTVSDHLVKFLHELSVYYLRHAKYDKGFTYLLACLEIACSIRTKAGMLKCFGLFEKYRHLSSPDIQTAFHQLACEVYEIENENSSTIFDM